MLSVLQQTLFDQGSDRRRSRTGCRVSARGERLTGTVRVRPDTLTLETRNPFRGIERETANEDGEAAKQHCSAGERRSSLQAMASRIVCSCGGRSRAPPVKQQQAIVRRARSAPGDRNGIWPRPARWPSGSPSRRTQISATSARVRSVIAKAGLAAPARWMKSVTPAICARSSSGGSDSRSGGQRAEPENRVHQDAQRAFDWSQDLQ